ncbi:MAG TPA: hypothetical protein VLL05_05170 [Terriglobales bacterium]|nr:hypothetical protein [Terriglobales bacterium]
MNSASVANCRKHFRWTQDGKQHRQKAGTRSWQEAEEGKRRLEDQLAGRTPTVEPEVGQTIDAAVVLFLQDKNNQCLTKSVLGKYIRELDRLRAYCEAAQVFVVRGVNRELLTGLRDMAGPLPFCRNAVKGPRARAVLSPLLLRGTMAAPRARAAQDQSGRAAHNALDG